MPLVFAASEHRLEIHAICVSAASGMIKLADQVGQRRCQLLSFARGINKASTVCTIRRL